MDVVHALGLCLLYSPHTSEPDDRGRRHRVAPFAFDLGNVADVRFLDVRGPAPVDLGTGFRMVDTPTGIRLEILDSCIVKRLKKTGGALGLAAAFDPIQAKDAYGVSEVTKAKLRTITVTQTPIYDAAQLLIVR